MLNHVKSDKSVKSILMLYRFRNILATWDILGPGIQQSPRAIEVGQGVAPLETQDLIEDIPRQIWAV